VIREDALFTFSGPTMSPQGKGWIAIIHEVSPSALTDSPWLAFSNPNIMKTLKEKLIEASLILRDNEQYNDDPSYNPEGEAADACDDAIKLMDNILELMKGKDYDHVKLSMISNMLKK
jgi:hypothetical protein